MSRSYILPITLTSIDSSTFTGSYQVVNSSGLAYACSILRLVNNSTKDVTVSYNGTTDHDFVKAGGELLLNLQTNNQPQGGMCLITKGTKIYVKGAAGTGSVYLSGYYQI